MKRRGASAGPTASLARSKKYCLKMFGSSVVPDFDETTKSVRARSTFLSHARICAGSVESRTWSSGKPAIGPKVAPRTSGQRLEPGELVVDDPEPPEPARLVAAGPQRLVAGPEAARLACLHPVAQRGPHRPLELVRKPGVEPLHRRLASERRAASTTCSAVNPNFVWSSLRGAEAPNVCIPMTSPPAPTYRLQPKVEACSTPTRAPTAGGSTASRYAAGWCSKSSHDGMDTTRARTPAAVSRSYASTQSATSLPEASRMTSGAPAVASAST